jgi:hypothetical protein
LPENIEERTATRYIVHCASSNDEKLPRPRGVGIAKHRRCHITLLSARMLISHMDRALWANRTHWEMYRPGCQSRGKTIGTELLIAKYHLAHSRIVGEHSDNDVRLYNIVYRRYWFDAMCC